MKKCSLALFPLELLLTFFSLLEETAGVQKRFHRESAIVTLIFKVDENLRSDSHGFVSKQDIQSSYFLNGDYEELQGKSKIDGSRGSQKSPSQSLRSNIENKSKRFLSQPNKSNDLESGVVVPSWNCDDCNFSEDGNASEILPSSKGGPSAITWGSPCTSSEEEIDICANATLDFGFENSLVCNEDTWTCQCLKDQNGRRLKWSDQMRKCVLPQYYTCWKDNQCESPFQCLRAVNGDYDNDPGIPNGYPKICKGLSSTAMGVLPYFPCLHILFTVFTINCIINVE